MAIVDEEFLPVDRERARDAICRVGINSEAGNAAFFENRVRPMGFSDRQIRNKLKDPTWPVRLPASLVKAFAEEGCTGIEERARERFDQIDFGVMVRLFAEKHNTEDESLAKYALKDFRFELREARTVAVDPDDDEIDLRIKVGFDEVRLTLEGVQVRAIGNESIFGEMKSTAGEDWIGEAGCAGTFVADCRGRDPLSWTICDTVEGRTLNGFIEAKGPIALIEAQEGGPVSVEVTAAPTALRVRMIDDPDRKTEKTLSDLHRDRMCAHLARRSVTEKIDEFLVSQPMVIEGKK